MCDYSLQMVKSRPAQVADKLRVFNFGTGTRGFTSADEMGIGANATAVCVLPGTELAFDKPVKVRGGILSLAIEQHPTTAIFRQINKEQPCVHHDVLEFADGTNSLLTYLEEGQIATVLQLPAAPQTEKEREEQTRAAYV